MLHLPAIIVDLALILGAAGFVTILFRRIRQPVVLGYILAGLIVGPNISIFPTVSDLPNIQIWAEIGVIFLLFALGLEFSFKKLGRVGGAASLTALMEIMAMVGIGFLAGRVLGWTTMDSIFLGGILAISSTTIIIRAFEEAGAKGLAYVQLVFGALIVEDLVAILLLVVLSTIAVSDQFAGLQLALSVGKLGFVLVLWFLVGIFVLPTLIRKSRPYTNDETLLVVSLGLCFLMVVFAVKVGFSPALGAFVMGSILAETTEAERIEHLIKPVKDLFAAVFFVSVGMMINPEILLQYAGPILLLTAVTIIGKVVSTMAGALLAGQGLQVAVQSGFSLAQIGEFSFIIAALGQSLNVTSDFLYPVAVGVSAITTFTTPYLIGSADRAYAGLVRVLPARWLEAMDRYSASARSVSATNEWGALLRDYFIRVGASSVLIVGIFLALGYWLTPFLLEHLESPHWARGIALACALVLSSPFFWSLIFGHLPERRVGDLWRTRRYRAAVVALEGSRAAVALALFALLAPQFITVRLSLGLTLGLLAIILLLLSRYLRKAYTWFESQFMDNLSERERAMRASVPTVAPWDAHITHLEVSPESDLVGKTMAELAVRERFGVMIAMIERGTKRITAPSRGERLMPHDKIAVIGTDAQISDFDRHIRPPVSKVMSDRPDYALRQMQISPESPYCGKSVRESKIRETTDGLIVGVERSGERILNPDSSLLIEAGDVLWIVGASDRIDRL